MSDQAERHPFIVFARKNPSEMKHVKCPLRSDAIAAGRKAFRSDDVDAYSVYDGETIEAAKARVLAEVMAP